MKISRRAFTATIGSLLPAAVLPFRANASEPWAVLELVTARIRRIGPAFRSLGLARLSRRWAETKMFQIAGNLAAEAAP